MSQSPFPGPIAPFNNPPISPENYKPMRFVISALTLGPSTTVTTSEDHDFVVGQQVRFLVPLPYRTYQLNEMEGYVIEIPTSSQVIVNIDSSSFNDFVSSPSHAPTLPEIIPIGDINTPAANASGRSSTTTFIPGSFINISPQ